MLSEKKFNHGFIVINLKALKKTLLVSTLIKSRTKCQFLGRTDIFGLVDLKGETTLSLEESLTLEVEERALHRVMGRSLEKPWELQKRTEKEAEE